MFGLLSCHTFSFALKKSLWMHDLFKKRNRPKSTFITRILQDLYVPFLGGIKHHLYDHKHDEFSRHVFVRFLVWGGGDKYPLNVCQLSSNFVFVIFTFSPKLVKKVTKPSLKKITHLHHQKGHGGRNSGYQGSPSLRLFQHTPGTYPTPWTKTLWRNCFHLGVLGMPGVCSRGMLGFS